MTPRTDDPPFCFILSYERPVYLWATLYSLLRNTRKPLRYVLIDNNSQDPLVAHVIRGFERRGMFHEVRMCAENDPRRMQKIITEFGQRLGAFFYFVENDVMVPQHVCWASVYEQVYLAHPMVGMVGSLCETDDFTDEEIIRREFPGMSDPDVSFYSYSGVLAVERTGLLDPSRDATFGDFPNPPGRLLLLSTEGLMRVGGLQTDSTLARELRAAGYTWYITPKFRHRHLSLMAYFDYPNGSTTMPIDYAAARATFLTQINGNAVKRFYRRVRRWFLGI